MSEAGEVAERSAQQCAAEQRDRQARFEAAVTTVVRREVLQVLNDMYEGVDAAVGRLRRRMDESEESR
jgi:hypothetical protein